MTYDKTNLRIGYDTHNHNIGNTIFAQGDGTPWYRISSPIKPLYEVLVVADYWYGYKAVDGSSSCAS